MALTRKNLLLLFFALIFIISSGESEAKVYIDLSAPAIKKLPVIVREFKYTGKTPADPRQGQVIENIKSELRDSIVSDLKFSNLFAIVEGSNAAQIPDVELQAIELLGCRQAGADLIIKGTYSIDDKTLVSEITMLDCVNEQAVLEKRYYGSAAFPRRLIHYFSDQLYEELTGKKGIFSTRLLFVSGTGGNKEIYVSDYDGRGARQITRNKAINLSPQWSPDGKKMLYISYKSGAPALYMFDLTTGRDAVISDKQGLNIAGRFSPDGRRVALTLSAEKSPELYALELASRALTRLTDNHGIDVSPTWSPDGAKIAYTSDAAGNPHIYVLDVETKEAKRMTYNGKYNSSPAWSPDGGLIAFSRSDGSGRFNIWTIRPDGANETQITFEGNNKNPSWSPDGRFIVFSSTRDKVTALYVIRLDGTGLTRITSVVGNETMPAWSPFLK